jgi:hypothetical protein
MRRYLLWVGCLLVAVGLWVAKGRAEDAEPAAEPVTITLRDAPIRQALDTLFRGRPCRYELPPEYADRRLSVEATGTQWCDALREALDSADLEYSNSEEASVFHIEPAGSYRRRQELRLIMEHLPAGKRWLLYVVAFGDRDQVRLRAFPYDGGEAVLWETPPGGLIHYLLPSPDCARALVVWRGRSGPQAVVLTIRDAVALSVEGVPEVHWAVWRDATRVALLVAEDGGPIEKTFDVVTRTLSTAGPFRPAEGLDPELPFLLAPLRGQAEAFRKLVSDRSLSIPFEAGHGDEAGGAIARGTGIPYVMPAISNLPIAHPVAAVAPDGEHIALTTSRSQGAVFIVVKGRYRAGIDSVIPLSQLVSGESVLVSQLQWSPDGKQLVFSEVHFHPARFHAADIGGDVPDRSDWTFLVRMWSRDTGRTETIAVGRNAWLMPEHAGAKGAAER